MSARIARGSAAASKGRGRKGGASGRSGGRKQRKTGLIEEFGLAPETVRRLRLWLLLIAAVALTLAALAAFRVPQTVGTALGRSIGDAGFAVRRVEIRGLNRMQRLPVYAVALDQESMAMPLVDLEGTRQRLLRFGWVREARVSRRLPDTLVIDVVERQPAAIWQHRQRLSLIDRDGVVLERVRLDAMPDLPVVIGPAANRHASSLSRLFNAAPHLKPLAGGATWIGGRRWDIRFQTGEVLALPEGEEAARRALVAFARMDQQTQLLGRGFARFDMRIPGKFIVRVSRVPGSKVPDLGPDQPIPAEPPQDLSRTI